MPHDGGESAEQIKRYLQGAEREARRRENKASRKKQRRNDSPSRPRDRGWDLIEPDAWDEGGVPLSERVMPLGAGERTQPRGPAAAVSSSCRT